MIIYKGTRKLRSSYSDKIDMLNGNCEVTVSNGDILFSQTIEQIDDRTKLWDWSYFGIYPLNLAKSILVHFFDMEDPTQIPKEMIVKFCGEVIGNLSYMDWEINEDDLREYLKRLYEEITGVKSE